MGQNPICYTKAYELMGKGVGTGLVGLYYRLACAQARHAQCLDRAENATASWTSLRAQQVTSQLNN